MPRLTTSKNKMYLIVRDDLSPGAQAVQAAHALQQFNLEHADTAQKWCRESNYLAFLSVPNEASLVRLAEKARKMGLKTSAFIEPDLDDSATAIAIEPGSDSKRLCRNIPLALS